MGRRPPRRRRRIWHAISDPAFTRQLGALNVFRKHVAFGDDGWLTAEVAAVDKDRNGKPDSSPGLATTTLPDGERAARISEPSWDAGVLIRPTRPLPAAYRAEMTLRGLDFGGERDGRLTYDGHTNGYKPSTCKTAFPWTFTDVVDWLAVRVDRATLPAPLLGVSVVGRRTASRPA